MKREASIQAKFTGYSLSEKVSTLPCQCPGVQSWSPHKSLLHIPQCALKRSQLSSIFAMLSCYYSQTLSSSLQRRRMSLIPVPYCWPKPTLHLPPSKLSSPLKIKYKFLEAVIWSRGSILRQLHPSFLGRQQAPVRTQSFKSWLGVSLLLCFPEFPPGLSFP